jgi:hypothetical protein
MKTPNKPNSKPDQGNGKLLMNLPCKHSIQSMKQEDAGYHCSSCDKHLIDFRGKQRNEIIEHLRNTTEKVCGVFERSQFEFKVSTVAFSAAQSRLGLSLLGILGFLGPVITSCEPSSEDATELKQHAFSQLKFPMQIKGTLENEATGKAVSSGTIQVLQNGRVIRKVKTDASGKFVLILEKHDLEKEHFDLVFSGNGIIQDTLKNQGTNQGKIQLKIQAEPSQCGTETGKVVKKSINETYYATPGEMIVEGKMLYVEPEATLGEPSVEEPK